jgi:hypothetical protein
MAIRQKESPGAWAQGKRATLRRLFPRRDDEIVEGHASPFSDDVTAFDIDGRDLRASLFSAAPGGLHMPLHALFAGHIPHHVGLFAGSFGLMSFRHHVSFRHHGGRRRRCKRNCNAHGENDRR